MPDISLITSLYRSEKHLPLYIERVQQVSAQLELSLQIVVVVNDATQTERDLLKTLLASDTVEVKIINCERETLYASWNRGITEADSNVLGFWNVDDIRTVEGLTEGFRLLSAGADLVDFAFNIQSDAGIVTQAPEYLHDKLHPKTGVGPFFMIHRRLYELAGQFNENFRIVGDYEFSKRELVREANTKRSDVIAGTFVIHGGNLSGGASPREWVEFNIALMFLREYHFMRPVDPELFKSVWAEWGDDAPDAPVEILDWLIGDDAKRRYQKYTYERQQHPVLRRIRLALARRGLWRSVEWDVHHG